MFKIQEFENGCLIRTPDTLIQNLYILTIFLKKKLPRFIISNEN